MKPTLLTRLSAEERGMYWRELLRMLTSRGVGIKAIQKLTGLSKDQIRRVVG